MLKHLLSLAICVLPLLYSGNSPAATYEFRTPKKGISVAPPFVPTKVLSTSTPTDFPPTQVNNTASPQSITIKNTGNTAVSIASVAITAGAADYSVSSTCTTLTPEATCQATITFKPSAAGPRPGKVTITSNETVGTREVLLAGTGAAPPTYATWNPAAKGPTAQLSNGNLTVAGNISGSALSTIGKSSGKWYWEVTFVAQTTPDNYSMIGIGTGSATLNRYPGDDSASTGYLGENGWVYTSRSAGERFTTFTVGDVIGVALDMDNGILTYYKNGVYQGIGRSGLTGAFYAMVGSAATASTITHTANFGATPFVYPVPAGFNRGLYN